MTLAIYDRQVRIPGWDQSRLARAQLAVCGRDLLGCYTAWGARSLGFGEVVWVGAPRQRADSFARFVCGEDADALTQAIRDLSMPIHYGPELEWALAGDAPAMLLAATDDREEAARCDEFAGRRGVRAAFASADGDGWFGYCPPPRRVGAWHDPVRAMFAAGTLIDAAREVVCPLAGALLAPQGDLGWVAASDARAGIRVLLVGAGAIGTYAAAVLAATYAERLHLRIWDFDHVEAPNLNRQGFFTAADVATRAPKTDAICAKLSRLVPGAVLESRVHRILATGAGEIDALDPRPEVLLSAVDNAETRLVIQNLGERLGIPVIQAGTATFAADCYVQLVGGRTLDEQMRGALTQAAAEERGAPRRGGCLANAGYVVPGMMAGAMLAERVRRIGGSAEVPPVHWRSGALPQEAGGRCHAIDVGEFVAAHD